MTEFPLLEGTAVGSLVAVAVWMFWQRARAERSVDDRVIRQLDERDETIRTLNERNRELNDRMAEMMRDSIRLATTHGQQLMSAIAAVRRENHEAVARLGGKLEQCERHHAACAARVEELERRIDGSTRG